MGERKGHRVTSTRHAWLRLTAAFGLVVIIVIAGSWVAIPGVNQAEFIGAVRCGDEPVSFYMQPVLCRGSYQPLEFAQLGAGYLALLVGILFGILWLRQRLTR